MFFDETAPDLFLRGLLLAPAALVWVVAVTRIVGLRSFSKMTSFDFVTTIGTGSLLAGAAQATTWPSFAQALVAMGSLFLAQWAIAWARVRFEAVDRVIQNTPVVVMENGSFDHRALRSTRAAKRDMLAKLREANVADLSQVRAVVLETTGDVSVLQGEGFDPDLLEGVERYRNGSVGP